MEHFPEIISLLPGMAGRFATTLDRADIGFLPDGTLDELPRPARTGATRTGGIGPQRLQPEQGWRPWQKQVTRSRRKGPLRRAVATAHRPSCGSAFSSSAG